jgi:putative DNA methylase
MPPSEVITRRRIPHWFVPGAFHFVTYRLAGTIPADVLERLRAEHEALLRNPPLVGSSRAAHRERAHKGFFARYDAYLDANREIDWLARPAIAAVIRGNLYHHHGTKYHLLAYCVMPNHVHVLFQPTDTQMVEPGDQPIGEHADARGPLAAIMHSLKSYTANQANALLGRSGTFWQHESLTTGFATRRNSSGSSLTSPPTR